MQLVRGWRFRAAAGKAWGRRPWSAGLCGLVLRGGVRVGPRGRPVARGVVPEGRSLARSLTLVQAAW